MRGGTDEQLGRIKQTLVATFESKKEILMQSARTEKIEHMMADSAGRTGA